MMKEFALASWQQERENKQNNEEGKKIVGKKDERTGDNIDIKL